MRLSRSYGPGRYDRTYEERGLDYPIGYVRWTEQRNLAAFATLLADRRVTVDDLITARVPVDEATEAYDRLVNGVESPLGLILTYEPSPAPLPASEIRTSPRRSTERPGGRHDRCRQLFTAGVDPRPTRRGLPPFGGRRPAGSPPPRRPSGSVSGASPLPTRSCRPLTWTWSALLRVMGPILGMLLGSTAWMRCICRKASGAVSRGTRRARRRLAKPRSPSRFHRRFAPLRSPCVDTSRALGSPSNFSTVLPRALFPRTIG